MSWMSRVLEGENPVWQFEINLVLPKLIAYLDLDEILKCRLVSKAWLFHIDTLLCNENPLVHPYNKDLYLTTLHHRLPSNFLYEQCQFGKLMQRYQFRRSGVLTGFTRKMASQLNSNRNPIMGRYVSLGLISANIEEEPKLLFRNIPEYWINVEKFLRNWGKNIWYLQLGDDARTHTSVEFYLLLVKFLELMPDLKYLDIPSLQLNTKRKSSETLPDTIERNPLPALPNLESILFPASGYIPVEIQHAMVQAYARQLKNLRFGLNTCVEDYPHILTKLNELSVFYAGSNETLSKVLGLFTIPLKKLVLDLRGTPKAKVWSVECILGILQDFPVKVAVLKLGNAVPFKENRLAPSIPIRVQFRVETLETLEMEHSPGTSYNFLWCLPALKNFHIEFNPYVEGDLTGNLVKLLVGAGSGTQVKEEDQEVDIRELMETGGDLYESNIWQVVPRLEVLTYTRLHWCWWPTRSVYTRGQYEWQKRQKFIGRRRRSRSRIRRRQKSLSAIHSRIMSRKLLGITSESNGEINMRRLHSFKYLTLNYGYKTWEIVCCESIKNGENGSTSSLNHFVCRLYPI